MNATLCSENGKSRKKKKGTEHQKIVTSLSANASVNLILMGEKKAIQMSN